MGLSVFEHRERDWIVDSRKITSVDDKKEKERNE